MFSALRRLWFSPVLAKQKGFKSSSVKAGEGRGVCSGDPRDWFTAMAVFPCGMLQTAVSYPVSESSVVLT